MIRKFARIIDDPEFVCVNEDPEVGQIGIFQQFGRRLRKFRKSAAISSIFNVQESYGYHWKAGGIPVSKMVLRGPDGNRKRVKSAFSTIWEEAQEIQKIGCHFLNIQCTEKLWVPLESLRRPGSKNGIAGSGRQPEAGQIVFFSTIWEEAQEIQKIGCHFLNFQCTE